MLEVTPEILIDDGEIEERFVRASGPGGQNVNKVSTAVELRFNVTATRVIADEVKQRLRAAAGRRMTEDGVLVIDARRHRTQARNREDARARLAELIRSALVPPKRRRGTRPTRGSVEQRMQTKRRRASTKRQRGGVRGDE